MRLAVGVGAFGAVLGVLMEKWIESSLEWDTGAEAWEVGLAFGVIGAGATALGCLAARAGA